MSASEAITQPAWDANPEKDEENATPPVDLFANSGISNISGLARLIRTNAMAALENIPLWHERDISHSSVERVILPDTTLMVDYALNRMTNILSQLNVYPKRMKLNLEKNQAFLATQKILLALVKKGVDRQKGYELVQRNALDAWLNEKNFRELVENDSQIQKYFASSPFLRHTINFLQNFERINGYIVSNLL